MSRERCCLCIWCWAGCCCWVAGPAVGKKSWTVWDPLASLTKVQGLLHYFCFLKLSQLSLWANSDPGPQKKGGFWNMYFHLSQKYNTKLLRPSDEFLISEIVSVHWTFSGNRFWFSREILLHLFIHFLFFSCIFFNILMIKSMCTYCNFWIICDSASNFCSFVFFFWMLVLFSCLFACLVNIDCVLDILCKRTII